MTVKITVSLPDNLVAAAKRAVDQGQAASVSAYVAAALEEYREPETLQDFLADMDHELGPVPPEVLAWARAVGDSIDSGAPTPPRRDVSQ
jgi:Arc/MetJ-type ribon-helix-helix transcriptional regulator